MTEATPGDMLQPALLDRLMDESPGDARETRERRVLSMSRLREAVLRDLDWLLNAGNLEPTGMLDDFPLVRESVLNYGTPDLTGLTTSGLDARRLAASIREAIVRFEPRIDPDSLDIRVDVDGADGGGRHRLAIVIDGLLWANPAPEHLRLRTELDLETGHYRLERT